MAKVCIETRNYEFKSSWRGKKPTWMNRNLKKLFNIFSHNSWHFLRDVQISVYITWIFVVLLSPLYCFGHQFTTLSSDNNGLFGNQGKTGREGALTAESNKVYWLNGYWASKLAKGLICMLFLWHGFLFQNHFCYSWFTSISHNV